MIGGGSRLAIPDLLAARAKLSPDQVALIVADVSCGPAAAPSRSRYGGNDMTEGLLHQVVVNDEEQHSVWTDMRPRSQRLRLDGA